MIWIRGLSAYSAFIDRNDRDTTGVIAVGVFWFEKNVKVNIEPRR